MRNFIPIGLFILFIVSGQVSAALDTSKIGISNGDEYEYLWLDNLGDESLILDNANTMEVADGDTFTVEIDEIPEEGSSILSLKITSGDNTLKLEDDMTKFGAYAIYTDWIFWGNTDNVKSSGFIDLGNLVDNTTENNGIFEYRFEQSEPELFVNKLHVFYNMEDGMTEKLWVYLKSIDLFTGKMTLTVDYTIERISTNYASAPISYPAIFLGLFVIVIVVRRR